MHTLKAQELQKKIKDLEIVKNVSLEVSSGEVVGLLGPNAAGKSTTIKMLVGAIAPSSGEASVAGFDIFKEQEKMKHHIGYVAQYFGLYEELSVLENIRFYASMYGVEDEVLFEVLMQKYKISHFKEKLAGELSGGYLRRLALICALTHDPDVLFLDEPTAGIDPVTRKILWDIFYSLAQEGKTIFVTTHYMEEAERCNKIAFLNSGKIVAKGTPEEIRHSLSKNNIYVLRAKFDVQLVKELEEEPEIELINQYGHELRFVVAKRLSKEALHEKIAPFVLEAFSLEESEANLEDVFIALTQERSS